MPITGPFRCLSCGALAEIDAPGMLTLGVKGRPIDATAPTCPCGRRRWVRAGTMSEYYMWRRRADVCTIGNHVDPRTRAVELVPRHPSEPPREGYVAVVALQVHVCPDHMDDVRTRGVFGCFPKLAPKN